MKERIQHLLDNGFTYADISFKIRELGGTYTGTSALMNGKIGAPTTIHMKQLKKAVEALEAGN